MNNERNDFEGLGRRFWGGFIAVLILGAIAAFVFFMIFGMIWAEWGLIGAFLIVVAIALIFGYVYDRRERAQRRSLAA